MEIKDIIYLGIAIVSALFGLIMWVRRPQEKGELNDAVFDIKVKNIDDKFSNLSALVVNLRDNHLHTLQSKLETHITESQLKGENDARWQGRIETLMEQLTKK